MSPNRDLGRADHMFADAVTRSQRLSHTTVHLRLIDGIDANRLGDVGVELLSVRSHPLDATALQRFDELIPHHRNAACEVRVRGIVADVRERQVEIVGPDALRLTELITPRDISKCAVGQCMYAPLCDENGGIINDPIILRLAEDRFWFLGNLGGHHGPQPWRSQDDPARKSSAHRGATWGGGTPGSYWHGQHYAYDLGVVQWDGGAYRSCDPDANAAGDDARCDRHDEFFVWGEPVRAADKYFKVLVDDSDREIDDDHL